MLVGGRLHNAQSDQNLENKRKAHSKKSKSQHDMCKKGKMKVSCDPYSCFKIINNPCKIEYILFDI